MMTTRDLADRLNLKKYSRSWRGRCPACDYPGSVFSVREVRGRTSLYCANGCPHNVLQDALGRMFSGSWLSPKQGSGPDDATRRARNQARALALWAGSEPANGTIADRYLHGRGLAGLASSAALRFRPDTPHPETRKLPALIALVLNAAGASVAVHRTFLRSDGSGKADAEPAKASIGPVWGGAIRLDPIAPELLIGEGIETAASAGRLLGLPAWAAISAGNLARGLVLPPEVRSVVIAADPDNAGRDAARDAWLRWTGEGRRVRIALPDGTGDFNDVLRAREVAHA
jgi:putative DNA primase/helicase